MSAAVWAAKSRLLGWTQAFIVLDAETAHTIHLRDRLFSCNPQLLGNPIDRLGITATNHVNSLINHLGGSQKLGQLSRRFWEVRLIGN